MTTFVVKTGIYGLWLLYGVPGDSMEDTAMRIHDSLMAAAREAVNEELVKKKTREELLKEKRRKKV